MPGSVYEAGLADEVLALDQLASRISQLVMAS
jgi:chemotaxis response regulator CheB